MKNFKAALVLLTTAMISFNSIAAPESIATYVGKEKAALMIPEAGEACKAYVPEVTRTDTDPKDNNKFLTKFMSCFITEILLNSSSYDIPRELHYKFVNNSLDDLIGKMDKVSEVKPSEISSNYSTSNYNDSSIRQMCEQRMAEIGMTGATYVLICIKQEKKALAKLNK